VRCEALPDAEALGGGGATSRGLLISRYATRGFGLFDCCCRWFRLGEADDSRDGWGLASTLRTAQWFVSTDTRWEWLGPLLQFEGVSTRWRASRYMDMEREIHGVETVVVPYYAVIRTYCDWQGT
jgi:hypothetical protein